MLPLSTDYKYCIKLVLFDRNRTLGISRYSRRGSQPRFRTSTQKFTKLWMERNHLQQQVVTSLAELSRAMATQSKVRAESLLKMKNDWYKLEKIR